MPRLPDPGSFPLTLRSFTSYSPQQYELLLDYDNYELYLGIENNEIRSVSKEIYEQLLRLNIRNTKLNVVSEDIYIPAKCNFYKGVKLTGTSISDTIFTESGIEYANENDIYVNTTTGNVYQCTQHGSPFAATWVYKPNINIPSYIMEIAGSTTPMNVTIFNSYINHMHALPESKKDKEYNSFYYIITNRRATIRNDYIHT